MSIPTSQYIPPPHFPWVTISLFSTSGMPLLALHTAMYIQGRSQHLFSSLHHHSWTNQQLGENSLLQHMPFDWETRQKVSKHFSLMFASHVFQELFHPLYISSFVQSYMMIIALSCDIQQHHFLKFIYLFIYFWLCWVFVAARGLPLVAASRGYSSLRCAGCSLRWLLLLQSTGCRRAGFSRCGSRALERRLSSCGARA